MRLRFEARDLKPYAEPVQPDELKLGATYFAVYFADDDMFVPVLEPRVYVGNNLESGDADQYYFQDWDSYAEGARYDVPSIGLTPVFDHGDAIKHMFTFEKALDVLLACSTRRQEKGA